MDVDKGPHPQLLTVLWLPHIGGAGGRDAGMLQLVAQSDFDDMTRSSLYTSSVHGSERTIHDRSSVSDKFSHGLPQLRDH